MSKGLTQEWLDLFADDRAKGCAPVDSIFWRSALETLPEGVDESDPRVVETLRIIKESVERSK